MKLLVAVVVLVVIGIAAVIVSGAYDVGTSNHDNALMNWALDTAMTRSVERHAKGIAVPPLSDPAMVQRGFQHYREMCVECHGAPGVAPGEIAKGLFPDAPDLAKTAGDWKPAELYWIIKNGLKFTAMPAWGPTHDERALWAVTAFVERLPRLSAADYKAMAALAGPGGDEDGAREGGAGEGAEHVHGSGASR
jgi:mono/diheme cytochrome c family protein